MSKKHKNGQKPIFECFTRKRKFLLRFYTKFKKIQKANKKITVKTSCKSIFCKSRP